MKSVYQRKIPLNILEKGSIIFDLDIKNDIIEKLSYNPKVLKNNLIFPICTLDKFNCWGC